MHRLAAALVAGCLAAGPALAQHACPGHLSATAIAPLPANAVYGATLRDDSPVQRDLRDRLFTALRQAGMRVGEPATLVLSWRGSSTAGNAPAGASSTDLMFSRGDHFADSDDLSWMQGTPRMSARVRENRAPPPPVRLSGRVELREVASGRVIWTAVLSCTRQGADQAALASALVAAVVPAIGQTLAGRPF